MLVRDDIEARELDHTGDAFANGSVDDDNRDGVETLAERARKDGRADGTVIFRNIGRYTRPR